MDKPTTILSSMDGFGLIYDCDCGAIHLQVGPVNLSLTHSGYMQLVDLVNTSAANFEALMQRTSKSND
jgi:hypothetical protein